MKLINHLASLFLFTLASNAYALQLKDCVMNNEMRTASINEHLFGGAPDDSQLIVKRAYVMSYNVDTQTPKWASWHITPAYRDTPKRKNIWSSFRQDPLFPEARSSNYTGWSSSEENLIRGHIVPYFTSGGDRDGDGMDAEFENSETLAIEDPDDACTVYEVNSMLNVAPQYHNAFNTRPGVWWLLENDVRTLVGKGQSFYIFAGTVFLYDEPVQMIGQRHKPQDEWPVGVPHGYFKILINSETMESVGFLFDHESDIKNGCNIFQKGINPSDCIVPLEDIEAVTGLTFFPMFSFTDNDYLRSFSSKRTWLKWLGY